MTESPTVELNLLRRFSPLDGLKNENLRALARKTALRELGQGRLLFKEGDADKRTFYLVSGIVELLAGGKVVGTVSAGSPDAKHPLAPVLPRRCQARVASDRIEYLSIDSDLLDVLLTWDQTGTYEVGDLQSGGDAGGDWMTVLLQSRAFHKIPPANLQAVFIRMQRVEHAAGDVIIRQGDEGDFFYVVVSGRCAVTRETPLNRDGIKLAELGMGDTFGEEALISGSRRNATVTMLTDGALMRLAKDDFVSLLNEPLMRRAPAERVRALPLRQRDQRAALLRAPQAEDARAGHSVRGVLRQRATQLGRGLPAFGTRLRRVGPQGRNRGHGTRRGAQLNCGRRELSLAGRQGRPMVTSCEWACPRRARRRDRTRSSAACCRGPVR